MKGRDLPAYVHRRKRDGVLLFRKRAGKGIVEIRLETQFPEGEKVPFTLHQEVERILSNPTPIPAGRTIKAVVKHYMASQKYSQLKTRTRSDYEKHLPYFEDKLGHLSPRNIERRHILSWLEAWAKKASPHFANYRLRVLRIVLEHSIDMGLLPTGGNPAKGVSELRYEKKERDPWPPELIKEFRKEANPRTLLVFELCLGTGQRISDVLKMKWGDIEDGGIVLRQNKTGKRLWVPLTDPLRTALDATEKRSVFILTNHHATGPWSYRGASDAVMKVRKLIGAVDYDIHALRHTTASELALAGADDDVIAAITGQSAAMVTHYTRTVRQKVRALKAHDLREQNKNET